MFKPTLRALCGVMAVMLAGLALGAMAQTVQPHRQPPAVPKSSDPLATPPAGLKWQWMSGLYFNANKNFPDTGTSDEKSLMAKVWAKEINETRDSPDGPPVLSFTLIGSIEHDGTKVILTMFNSQNSACIHPGNGGGMIDMYSTCPLRVIHFSSDGKSTVRDLQTDFCMLYGDDPNNPRTKIIPSMDSMNVPVSYI